MIVEPTTAEIRFRADAATPESWRETLARFSDANFYQTHAFGAVRWGAHRLSHFVMERGGETLAAAQVWIAEVPLLHRGLAHARWAPVWTRRDELPDPTIASEFLRGLRREYVDRRRLTLQITPNALVGSERAATLELAMRQSGFEPLRNFIPYHTIVVPLHFAAEDLRRRLNKKWRNQLNAAERNELVFEPASGAQSFAEFRRLYQVMRQRKRFEPRVDIEDFAAMSPLLGEAMPVFLCRKNGVAIAALVCACVGDTAVYLLGATNETARALKAAYFLQWRAMLWLKEHGAIRYDLGGIDRTTNPGGYHFKAGFGGEEHAQMPTYACGVDLLSRAIARCVTWRRVRAHRRWAVRAQHTVGDFSFSS